MAEIVNQRGELPAEAAGLGEDFGLGPCTAAYAVKRRSAGWWAGYALLLLAVMGGLVVIASSHGVVREAAAITAGALAAASAALMARSPRAAWDRLLRYPGGLAQLVAGAPEPLIVRWDDVVAVSMTFGSSDDHDALDGITISGRTGTHVTADEDYGPRVLGELARQAERALAARLLPELIRAYESGEPVTFGEMSIERWGIAYGGGPDHAPQRMPWEDIRRITVDGPGRGIKIQTGRMPGTWIGLADCPNGVLAHHVISRAAADVPLRWANRWGPAGRPSGPARAEALQLPPLEADQAERQDEQEPDADPG